MTDRCLPLCLAEPGFQDPVSPQKPAPATSTIKPEAATEVEDPELAKRQARAARFGIPLVDPLVESKQPTSTNDEKSKEQLPDVCIIPIQPLAERSFIPQDQTKLETRAKRFGKSNGQPRRKRGAEEPVDPEELARRKKRAERFGVPLAVSHLSAESQHTLTCSLLSPTEHFKHLRSAVVPRSYRICL